MVESFYRLQVKNRLIKITALPPEERLIFSSKVYSLLQTQRLLLRKLSNLIYGQPIMELFDSTLKAEPQQLVDSKERGLLSVGAALEFYFVFGVRLMERKLRNMGRRLPIFATKSGIVHEVLHGNSRRVISVNSAIKNIDGLEK